MRAQGIATLRRALAELGPWLAERVDALTYPEDVKLLDVQLNRLRRWHAGTGRPERTLTVQLVSRPPALRRLAGHLIAIGPLPEHAPKFARRRA